MFRRISALIVFVLILGVGCAALARSGDDADYTDIVLLKNGGKIQGKIVENNPDKKLVIERRGDYQRFEVPRKRIYAVTTVAEFDQVKARFNTEKPRSESTSMFRNIAQIGMIFGSGNRYFSALIINGVEFENGIILGAGLGFDAVEDGMVPLVAHIESNSSTGSHSMFLYGEAGYSFCWQKEGPRGGGFGGPTFSLGGGVKFTPEDEFKMHVRLGYRYQTFDIPDTYAEGVHYISAMTGFSF